MNEKLNELITEVTAEMDALIEAANAEFDSPAGLRWWELKVARVQLLSAAGHLEKAQAVAV